MVEGLDGDLLQVRVPQGDFLAIRHHQLFLWRVGMPVEQARALQRHLAGGFLQLGAGAIEGQLGKTCSQGLRLFKQLGQTRHILVIGMGRQRG
ncbi:hypothetical protein D3C71_1681620 [compost metagenome]